MPTTSTLIFFFVCGLCLSEAVPTCSGFVKYGDIWQGGAVGNFSFTFPSYTNGWSIRVTYTGPVFSLKVYDGANPMCSDNICTFTNANWNPVKKAATRVTLGFNMTMDASIPPILIGISLNRVVLCSGTSGPTPPPPLPNVIAVTQTQFNNAITSCNFTPPAVDKFNAFDQGIPLSGISKRRELAMFLANIIYASGGFQFLREQFCLNVSNNCSGYGNSPSGVIYYGRGYMQIAHDYNYREASQALYNDPNILLNDPDRVASDENVAWNTAFWFWKTKVHIVPDVLLGKFGASTKVINSQECVIGAPSKEALARYEYYKKVLIAFAVSELPIESGCYN